MAAKELPSPELVRKVLRYEPGTGKLFWRYRPIELFNGSPAKAQAAHDTWNRRYAGTEAFTSVDARGYRQGNLFARVMRGHRVAFVIHHGRWPAGQIDHINGDRLDNRPENMREVDDAENRKNMAAPKNNTSGRIGVCWFKPARLWVAQIQHNRQHHCLGYFKEFADAVAARERAEEHFGFHKNHGRRV